MANRISVGQRFPVRKRSKPIFWRNFDNFQPNDIRFMIEMENWNWLNEVSFEFESLIWKLRIWLWPWFSWDMQKCIYFYKWLKQKSRFEAGKLMKFWSLSVVYPRFPLISTLIPYYDYIKVIVLVSFHSILLSSLLHIIINPKNNHPLRCFRKDFLWV